MRKSIILLIVLLSPIFSHAHGSKIETVSSSVQRVLKIFESQNNEISRSFSGVKSWISSSIINVKVYYLEEDRTLNQNYQCQVLHSDSGEELLCALK